MKNIVEIRVGDEVRCERAILLEDRVRVFRDGVWIDLVPPLLSRLGARVSAKEEESQ